jgi:hypothetical protein
MYLYNGFIYKPHQMKYLDKILASNKTVFSYQDIENLLSLSNRDTIKSFFRRWIKDGVFMSITKWIYALKKYEKYELATKLKKNSYLSFETVLKKEWIIFQDYGNQIFLASDNTIAKDIDWVQYIYLKIKNDILMNPMGIISKWPYMIASRERAICDRVYLSQDYYLDSLDGVDLARLTELSQIYNKRVIVTVQQLISNYAQ